MKETNKQRFVRALRESGKRFSETVTPTPVAVPPFAPQTWEPGSPKPFSGNPRCNRISTSRRVRSLLSSQALPRGGFFFYDRLSLIFRNTNELRRS